MLFSPPTFTDSPHFTSVLLDSIEDGVAVYDRGFRYRVFNRAMERLTGLCAAEVLGRSVFEGLPHLKQGGLAEVLERALAGETVTSDPMRYVIPQSHRTGWAVFRHGPLAGADGACEGIVEIVRDVTQEKARDDAPSLSEQWFRSLTENTAEMVTVLHADGTTRYVSPSVERFLGVSGDAARDTSVFDTIHPEDLPLAREEFQRCLECEGAPLQVELRCRRADGAERRLLVVARNLLDDPVVRGVVLNTRDVTEQRDLEAQLQHAQRLDAIGRITGAVAHDFNNLITIIHGNASLAMIDLPPAQPGHRELEEIVDAAEKATKLTRQLLSFSRQQEVTIEQFSAAEAVRGVERLLARVMSPGQELVVDVDADAGMVRADRGQLEQVLMNLVSNARDAMPGGGTATLRCTAAQLSPQRARFHPGAEPGRYVRITVSDTGVGISADVMQRVFEPFFTTKERSKGTGLGLSTAYGIVQQFGGFMTVESTLGRGATFSVYLPAAAAV